MTLGQRLQRLQNRHTLYELVASHPDGRRFLVAYCGRRGRRGIFTALAGRAAAMTALTGDDGIKFAARAADGGTMGAWTIRFSGRTQRECYIAGELEYVAAAPTLPADSHPGWQRLQVAIESA
jgi:hypothetical protein